MGDNNGRRDFGQSLDYSSSLVVVASSLDLLFGIQYLSIE